MRDGCLDSGLSELTFASAGSCLSRLKALYRLYSRTVLLKTEPINWKMQLTVIYESTDTHRSSPGIMMVFRRGQM